MRITDTPVPVLSRPKQLLALATPARVYPSMRVVFGLTAARLGRRRGYLAGFVLYWVGWCVSVPLWLLGRQRAVALFRARPADASGVRRRDLLAVAVPPLLGFSVAFPRQIRQAGVVDVAGSALLAIVNATGEELLWRGVYLTLYPDAPLLNALYPSLGFAAWHYAPQSIFPNTRPGGRTSLVVTAGLVGGVYVRVAQRAGSLRWTTLSHLLFDFSGLGALLYRTDRGCP